MRECSEYEIPLWKFFKIIHIYTERVAIKVVTNSDYNIARNDGFPKGEYYLSEDIFGGYGKAEEERMLKYYKDAPIWNVHIAWDYCHARKGNGGAYVPVIVGNVKYADIREGWLAEKNDIRKAKQREYRMRKKIEKEKEMAE